MKFVLASVALIVSAGAASAAVIPVTNAFADNEKDNFTGNITDTYNGSGINGNPGTGGTGWPVGAGDPSTWTATSSSYQSEWQSAVLLTGASNNKIGWVIFDLSAATANLDKIYLWNEREQAPRAIHSYNIYYAVTPTVTVAHGPTNSTASDYNFASGGWTQLGGTGTMPYSGSVNGASADAVIDLGGVTARYLAVEILSNGGDTARVGLAEVGVTTAAPEPASLAIIGAGAALMLHRRRAR